MANQILAPITVVHNAISADVEVRRTAVSAPIATALDAYQLAVREGFVGNREQWLASLEGPPGPSGTPYVQADVPASPQHGQQWLDTDDQTFSVWDDNQQVWIEVSGANGFGVNNIISQASFTYVEPAPLNVWLKPLVDETLLLDLTPAPGETEIGTQLRVKLPSPANCRVGMVKTVVASCDATGFMFDGDGNTHTVLYGMMLSGPIPAGIPISIMCAEVVSFTEVKWLRVT